MVAAAPCKKLPRFGRFRWGAVAPWRAARVAFGVVVPLTVGWMTGNVVYGAFTALGALPAGLASFQGETRSRVAVVVAASLGMALSTFVGATVAAISPWLLVPVLAIWAYFTGLAVCLGPRASVAVLQWSIALIIAAGLPAGYKDAGSAPACYLLAVSSKLFWLRSLGLFGRAQRSERHLPPPTGCSPIMPPIWLQTSLGGHPRLRSPLQARSRMPTLYCRAPFG
jgi:hypothetical protein